jgi:hypothetical protein
MIDLPWLEVQERVNTTGQPAIVPWRLPSKHPPQHHKASWCAEVGAREVSCHCSKRWHEGIGKVEKVSRKKAKCREYGSASQIPSPFIHKATSRRCRARRFVSAAPTRATQTLTGGLGSASQTALVKQDP